ncbi:MAG: Bax inhibitor-1 family protein [Alloprevotella sp.]
MNNNIYQYSERESRSVTFPALMQKVYLWMTLALAVTGLTAFYIAGNEQLLYAIVGNPILFWGLLIGELALVWGLSANIHRVSFATAGILFALYSVLNGATLSVILMAYTMESIASTFFVTAGTFGAMSLVGLFTKRDLSAIGRFFFMALIGLIIATLVNMFLQSSGLSWALTYAGVLIFSGLTAYDTQKMKQILSQGDAADEGMMKIALMCSLSLYLDFVNLFLYLLRIFGDRK